MPSGMQKNKPSYPLLPTPISGGLIYPFPMDTAALGLSVLISGALARFIRAPSSPGAAALPGGNHLVCTGLCPHSCPSSHHLWGKGCKLQVVVWWEEQLLICHGRTVDVSTLSPLPPLPSHSGYGGARGQDSGMSLV